MSKHKRQHFVPSCYLRAWVDPDCPANRNPYVWRFKKDGTDPRRKAPENIFHETDMYTIRRSDGERDLRLEKGLQQLETQFASIRRKKLTRHDILTRDEHFLLCVFIAASRARTRVQRELLREQWREPLKQMDRMIEWMKAATPEQKQAAPRASLSPKNLGQTMTHEQVRRVVGQPLQTMLSSMIVAEAPLLTKLDFAIYETDDDLGFITSDHPCTWFDPEAYKRPPIWRGPALMYETIEISLPISPKQCILLNRCGIGGYREVGIGWVDDLNRRCRFRADEYFVARRNQTKPIWFDPGVEPADSWERTHQASDGP
jgi:Protein of unknown function (DUF4238)